MKGNITDELESIGLALDDVLKANVTLKSGGFFKLRRRKAIDGPGGTRIAGPVVAETPWCKNKNSVHMFNLYLGDSFIYYRGCVVGTGNTPPEETDTSLDSYLAATTSRQATEIERNWTVSPRFIKHRLIWRFGEGVAEGNVAEAGIVLMTTNGGMVDGSSPLGSRALVVDGAGDPTVIPVQGDEFLDVVWDNFWFVPEDVTGEFTVDNKGTPEDHDFTIRAVAMHQVTPTGNLGWSPIHGNPINTTLQIFPSTANNSWQNGGSVTQESQTPIGYNETPPGLAATAASDATASTYTPDSGVRTYTFVYSLDRANFDTGIGSFTFLFGFGGFQMIVDPIVEKTSSDIFEVDMTVTLTNAF